MESAVWKLPVGRRKVAREFVQRLKILAASQQMVATEGTGGSGRTVSQGDSVVIVLGNENENGV